ncbi:MAG: ArgE/DapE family deacylase [Gemmatimonadaceae bacterium]
MNAVELTAALVQFDSRNPSLVSSSTGERGVACFLGRVLDDWGFRTELVDVADGRCNLIARAGAATAGARTLMLNGHLDIVGTDDMTHPPFVPSIVDGLLYGRGSADMKGGIAAMCVAARDALQRGIAGQIVIAAVIDEEYESLGTRALVSSGVRTDAAIITEPTGLAMCPAHRGFVWARLDFRGRAAHGSRYDLGVDAITHAALVIAELHRLQLDVLHRRSHPLLGRPSLHASTIAGGTGLSTYPDRCTVKIERRTIPGETEATFLQELNESCHIVRSSNPTLDVSIQVTTSQLPSDVPLDAPVLAELERALKEENIPIRIEGLSAWTDAALLNEAGIPAICFGPGDIALAHSSTEWVPVQQIHDATRVLERFISTWCNGFQSQPSACS